MALVTRIAKQSLLGIQEGFQTATLTSQAETALSNFFTVWNSFPTGFTKATDISNVAFTTWAGYASATAAGYKGTNWSNLDSSVVSSYTLTFTYTNKTTSNSAVIKNVKVNTQSLSDLSFTINPQTSSTTYNCDDSAYANGGCPGQGRPYLTSRAGTASYTKDCYLHNPSYPANSCLITNANNTTTYLGPAQSVTITTDGTGTINAAFNLSPSINVYYIAFDISGANLIFTENSKQYTSAATYSKRVTSTQGLIYDFNNIYTSLLIDLYTRINTRHSTSPPVAYTAPVTPTTATSTSDRTNAMAGTNTDTIKTSYLSIYLPAQYILVLAQVKQMLSDLQGANSTTLAADTTTVNALPATSDSTNVVTNLITLTNIYNTYSSSYASLLRDSVFASYILKANAAYKKAVTYVETSAFAADTNTLFSTITPYISATNTANATYTTATATAAQITTLKSSCEAAIRDIFTKLIAAIPTLNQNNPPDFTVPTSVSAAITAPPTIPTAYADLENFGNTSVFKPFDDWTTAMKTYVKAAIDGYVGNAGTSPVINGATYKGYVDSTAAPWLLKAGNDDAATQKSFSAVPTLSVSPDSASTSSGQTFTTLDDRLNGTYKTTASSSASGLTSSYPFSSVTNKLWTTTGSATTASPQWLQIELPRAKSIWGYKLFGQSYLEKYKFQGSVDASQWDTLYEMITYDNVDVVFANPTKPYKYYRWYITSSGGNASVGIGTLTLYEYTGQRENTKTVQLRSIFNQIRNENFKLTYTAARRYITDSELSSTTIATRTAFYTGGTYTTADLLAARQNILASLVTKYGQLKSVDVSSDAITTTTTNAILDTVQSKYLSGTSSPLWPAYLEELRTTVNTYISTTYKNARDGAVSAGTMSYDPTVYFSNSDITRDTGYLAASGISQNIDLSGTIRHFISTTDAAGLIPLAGFEYYGSGTDAALYSAPASGTTITNDSKYSFTSNGLTFIVTTSPTSGWSGLSLINTLNSTGSRPGGDVILQFPKYATVSAISFNATCQRTDCVGTTLTLSGKNKDSDSWTSIASIPAGQRYISLNSPYPTYIYYQLNMTNIASINSIMYTGILKTPAILSEYGLVTQLYNKYKSAVDSIASIVRQPALTNLSNFRTMYTSLTNCIPTDFTTNVAYAPMAAAVTSSALAPSLAPSSSSDEAIIQTLTSASDVAPYTSKYAQQIVSLFTLLRQNQIDTLTAFGKLYNRYVQFQANPNIQQYSILPTLPSQNPSIPNNASIDLATMQGLPIPTTSQLPTDTNIQSLATNCTTYNSSTGRFQSLRTFLKIQLETFIGQFDALYNSLSASMKTAYPYTSPLLSSGTFPTTITAQQLYDYMNAYGGYTFESLYTTAAAPPTTSYIGNTSAAIEYMKQFYVDTYLPVRKYLRSVEFTADMQSAVTLCEKYITSTGALKSTSFVLQSGDTLQSIIQTVGKQTDAMISALITGFQTTHNTWSDRIPTLAQTDPVPSTLTTDAANPTLALRQSYLTKWDSLIAKVKQATKNRIQLTQSLRTWNTTPTISTTSIVGNTTKGLGIPAV